MNNNNSNNIENQNNNNSKICNTNNNNCDEDEEDEVRRRLPGNSPTCVFFSYRSACSHLYILLTSGFFAMLMQFLTTERRLVFVITFIG